MVAELDVEAVVETVGTVEVAAVVDSGLDLVDASLVVEATLLGDTLAAVEVLFGVIVLAVEYCVVFFETTVVAPDPVVILPGLVDPAKKVTVDALFVVDAIVMVWVDVVLAKDIIEVAVTAVIIDADTLSPAVLG